MYPGLGNVFRSNIVDFSDSKTAATYLSSYQDPASFNTSKVACDYNLVYKASQHLAQLSSLTPLGTLEQWQRSGQDQHGVFDQDPLFADINAGNFSLLPGSPALKAGFKPIDAFIAENCGP